MSGFADPPALESLDLSKLSPTITKQCLICTVHNENFCLIVILLVEIHHAWVFCFSYGPKEELLEYNELMSEFVT